MCFDALPGAAHASNAEAARVDEQALHAALNGARHAAVDARPPERVRVECDMALVQDANDDGIYELGLTMNDAPVLAVVFETQADALEETDRMLRDLLDTGWRYEHQFVLVLERLPAGNRG